MSAPFFLGASAAYWLLGVESLLSLPGVVVGLTVVALAVTTGIDFLAMKTRRSLQRDVADYGPWMMVAYLAPIVVTLGYLIAVRPDLGVLTPIPLAFVVVNPVVAAGYLLALRGGRYTLVFGAVPVFVFAFVALVATLMFSSADPVTGLTVADVTISVLPLNIMSVASALLLPLAFTYLSIFYSTFSGSIETGEPYS